MRINVVRFIIGWPISIAALFFIVKTIFPQFEIIFSNLQKINWVLVILSISCFLIYYFGRSNIWKLILKEKGHNIPLRIVAYNWEMSELKRFVPGAIWSFIGKTSLFGELGIQTRTVFKSILIEIEFFVLACLVVSTLSFSFLFQKVTTLIPYKPFLPILTASLVFLIIIIFIFSTTIANRINISYLNRIKRLLPLFPPKTNLIMLLIASIYVFFFGLGSYFAARSIFYIDPSLSLPLTGFFVFSLVTGSLSVFAPMGIGIREGIITLGLSKIIPLTIAGFVSIFARLLLIFSELCFILFVSIWHKAKSKYITAFENFVSIHKQEVILSLFIIVYIGYFTTASFLRYDNFYTGRFDLGNMDQTVWNTINGKIFELTDPNGTNIISRLAIHADFILILLSPFYLLWTHPKMLLLIQTVLLALGSVFVYAIAKNVIKNKNLAFTFGALFLLNPALQFTNLYDFHAVTLATTFLLGSFYFLLKKRYLWFLLFAVLAGLTKEQVWIIVALFGLYILFKSKKKAFGLTIFILSIIVFYYLIWHAIPKTLGSQHFALSYYSDFGDSPTDVIKNIFLSPQETLATLFQKNQLNYLNQLFLPLGFLSLFSPLHLIFALPDLSINLLSSNPKLHEIYYQYSAVITPFIFISAIFGLKNLKVWFPKIPYIFFIFYFLFFIFYSAYSYGPLPLAKKPNIDMFTKPQRNKTKIENFISNIPARYAVAATNNIGSHLSQRQKIFTIPNGIDKGDLVIFLVNKKNGQESFEKEIKMIKSNKNYKQIYKINESFMVFKKQTDN